MKTIQATTKSSTQKSRSAFGRFPAFFTLALVFVLSVACSRGTSTKEAVRHYQMSGVVVTLNPKVQTATIKHEAIKGWMDAMTMEYPVPSKSDFARLHEGDRLTATVDVSGSDYSLSNIQVQSGSR